MKSVVKTLRFSTTDDSDETDSMDGGEPDIFRSLCPFFSFAVRRDLGANVRELAQFEPACPKRIAPLL